MKPTNKLPDHPVFSPSSTQRWTFCPIAYLLDQEGWTSKKVYSPQLLPRLAGEAFALGALQKYTTVYSSGLRQVVEERVASMSTAGVTLGDSASWSQVVDRAVAKAELGLEALNADDPYRDHEFLVGEYAFPPQYGNARLDAAFRSPSGGVVVVDWKLMDRMPARHSYTHQIHHYVWCWQEWFGEAVARAELAVVSRSGVEVVPVVVTEESLAQWLQTSREAWHQMERHRDGIRPWMNPSHANSYGACEFQRACLDHFWDEALMNHDYVRVERTS